MQQPAFYRSRRHERFSENGALLFSLSCIFLSWQAQWDGWRDITLASAYLLFTWTYYRYDPA